MNSLRASFLAVIVLVNIIRTVYTRKNPRLCRPTITEDGLMFRGNDYVILPNQQYNAQNFHFVRLKFKTTVDEGLMLLITSSGNTVASQLLELTDGKLVFQLNLGSGNIIMASSERYTDGKWHVLEAKQVHNHCNLMIDGIIVSTGSIPENFNNVNQSSIIFIGGFKETHRMHGVNTKGFSGFLRDIQLGNDEIHLKSYLMKSNDTTACHKRRRRRREASHDTGAPSVSLSVVDVTVSSIEHSIETLDFTSPPPEFSASEGQAIRNDSVNETTDYVCEPGREYTLNLTLDEEDNYLNGFICQPGENEGEIKCLWGENSTNDCVKYQLNFSAPLNSSSDSVFRPKDVCKTRLLPGQNYSISIQYYAASNRSRVLTTHAIAKTGISSSFYKENFTYSTNRIEVSYHVDPGRLIEYYNITLENRSDILSATNFPVLFDNLMAGSYYELSAIAVSNKVESKPLSVNVSTVPNPPSKVECIERRTTSLTVKIGSPSNGGFDKFEITADGRAIIYHKEQLTADIDNLKAFTNYTIQVQSVMNFMDLHSEPIKQNCQTKEGTPGKVTNFNHTLVGTNGVHLTWSPPEETNGIITGYTIIIYMPKGDKNIRKHAKDTYLLLENERLKPGEKYKISIFAETVAGKGEEISIIVVLNDRVPSNALLVSALVILVFLLLILIGLLSYYFIRKSPGRMQSVRRLSNRLLHPNNEVRYFKQPAVSSKPVKLSDFLTCVQGLEKDSGLKITEEYEDLKFVGRNQSKDESELQCNRVKNRFTNILPYDISRVKLLAMEDEEGSDYINASWIPGFHSKREFIASQGPLPSTVNDFWRMVWENNCQAVVMLTLCMEKGHIKCEQYWPVQSEPVCYGDVKVELQNEDKNEEWHIRDFKISLGAQSHKLIHFHYVTWPDMYVPEKGSLLAFIRDVRTTLNNNNGKGPIVVHCSAGVGRTGTFVALDTLLHQMQAEHDLDVYGIVFQMRMNRVLMVQTEAQYTFIYECVRQVLEEKSGLSEIKTAIEGTGDAKTENCKEETKKEEAESNLNSDSKKEKEKEEPKEESGEREQPSKSGNKLKSNTEENSIKDKSNLNFEENGEIKDLETKKQDSNT